MKTGWIVTCAVLAFAMAAGITAAEAFRKPAAENRAVAGKNFVDADSDGVCDYKGQGKGNGCRGTGKHKNGR